MLHPFVETHCVQGNGQVLAGHWGHWSSPHQCREQQPTAREEKKGRESGVTNKTSLSLSMKKKNPLTCSNHVVNLISVWNLRQFLCFFLHNWLDRVKKTKQNRCTSRKGEFALQLHLAISHRSSLPIRQRKTRAGPIAYPAWRSKNWMLQFKFQFSRWLGRWDWNGSAIIHLAGSVWCFLFLVWSPIYRHTNGLPSTPK